MQLLERQAVVAGGHRVQQPHQGVVRYKGLMVALVAHQHRLRPASARLRQRRPSSLAHPPRPGGRLPRPRHRPLRLPARNRAAGSAATGSAAIATSEKAWRDRHRLQPGTRTSAPGPTRGWGAAGAADPRRPAGMRWCVPRPGRARKTREPRGD
ncbi:hypothetical protein G6F64_014439 [Rhizopus arrhizus]|uniref:Uncharacterized protein n=1 Tax=Rhizopus oryzae TaxID=64495 RepID=A0A9P6WTG4_RHIOR|nr:hypothetical protein G6F64_014439 [Rhizopus arrhizus]